MRATLVLPETIAREIEEASRLPLETAGVLTAAIVELPDGELRLLGQEMSWVPDDAYIERKSDRLTIASHGYVQALGRAERRRSVCLWLHTHPTEQGIPVASRRDHKVDRDIEDLFRLRTESPYYGTVIFSPRRKGVAFTGKIHHERGSPIAIDRLWQVGDGWSLTRAYNTDVPEIAPLFDRNVRAFGRDIQATLGDLHVGVVGCGGTGSAIAEQLVRLGVRRLTLVDADHLTSSNVTRVYGSTPADVGRLKVDVLKGHLEAIAPDLLCLPVPSMITLEPAARSLVGCDLVFGCTDDNAGRLVLSRLSTFLVVPVIDVGVLLSSGPGGVLSGIDGRVTVLTPGSACLVCRNRIDTARAASELMTPDERRRLANEGYAPALGGTEPAVVAFTTAVAAAAVNELLERLIGYGPDPRPSEVLLRWHEREISTNTAAPRSRHYCDPQSGKLGFGPKDPFLEQLWPTS